MSLREITCLCRGANCHALSILTPENTLAKNSFKLTLHRKVPLGWQEFLGELDGTWKKIQVEVFWFHSQIVIVMAGDEKSLHSTWLCISLASSKPIVCCLCRPTLLLLLANPDLWPHFWAKTPNCLGCLGYEVLPPADFHGNFSQGFVSWLAWCDIFPYLPQSPFPWPLVQLANFSIHSTIPERHSTKSVVFSVQKWSKSLNRQANKNAKIRGGWFFQSTKTSTN